MVAFSLRSKIWVWVIIRSESVTANAELAVDISLETLSWQVGLFSSATGSGQMGLGVDGRIR